MCIRQNCWKIIKITFKSLIIYFTAIELLKFQLSIYQEISKTKYFFYLIPTIFSA